MALPKKVNCANTLSSNGIELSMIRSNQLCADPIGQGDGKTIGQRDSISDFILPSLLPKRRIHILPGNQPYGLQIHYSRLSRGLI
jgi:hypothetical protein